MLERFIAECRRAYILLSRRPEEGLKGLMSSLNLTRFPADVRSHLAELSTAGDRKKDVAQDPVIIQRKTDPRQLTQFLETLLEEQKVHNNTANDEAEELHGSQGSPPKQIYAVSSSQDSSLTKAT